MIKSKSKNWIHNIAKTPTLEENTDYVKFMKEHVKQKEGGEKFVEISELQNCFKSLGLFIPACDLKSLEDDLKKNDFNQVSIAEFSKLYTSIKEKTNITYESNAKTSEKDKEVVKQVQKVNGYYSMTDSEKCTFSNWLNKNLAEDKDLNLASNPIDPDTNDLFARCKDGLLICKAVNFAVPNTIDEKFLKKGVDLKIYQQLENIELALKSAESIGCHVTNIRPIDISQGRENLILGLLWQIIKNNDNGEKSLNMKDSLLKDPPILNGKCLDDEFQKKEEIDTFNILETKPLNDEKAIGADNEPEIISAGDTEIKPPGDIESEIKVAEDIQPEKLEDVEPEIKAAGDIEPETNLIENIEPEIKASECIETEMIVAENIDSEIRSTNIDKIDDPNLTM